MLRSRLFLLPLIGLATGLGTSLEAQIPEVGGGPVAVDERGVMRWTATADEVALFGVNSSPIRTAPLGFSAPIISRPSTRT